MNNNIYNGADSNFYHNQINTFQNPGFNNCNNPFLNNSLFNNYMQINQPYNNYGSLQNSYISNMQNVYMNGQQTLNQTAPYQLNTPTLDIEPTRDGTQIYTNTAMMGQQNANIFENKPNNSIYPDYFSSSIFNDFNNHTAGNYNHNINFNQNTIPIILQFPNICNPNLYNSQFQIPKQDFYLPNQLFPPQFCSSPSEKKRPKSRRSK